MASEANRKSSIDHGPENSQLWAKKIELDNRIFFLKVSPRLTLNLGVRWDFEPPRTERYDRQIYWDSTYKWPWTPTPGWSWDLVRQQAGLNKATTPEPQWITKGIYGRAALVPS